jgi:RNA polymerase sigma factor (sigma-70 family)
MEEALELSLKEILPALASCRADDLAWSRLYECTRTYIFRVSCCVLRSETHLADDATQEVFIRLARYCTFRHFEDPNAFLAYVRVVCRNVARTFVAQTRKRGELPLAVFVEQARSRDGNDRQLTLAEMRTTALKHLGTSAPNRAILELWLDGSSLPEIATEVGMTYGAAAVRLHRIRQTIMQRNFNKIQA